MNIHVKPSFIKALWIVFGIIMLLFLLLNFFRDLTTIENAIFIILQLLLSIIMTWTYSAKDAYENFKQIRFQKALSAARRIADLRKNIQVIKTVVEMGGNVDQSSLDLYMSLLDKYVDSLYNITDSALLDWEEDLGPAIKEFINTYDLHNIMDEVAVSREEMCATVAIASEHDIYSTNDSHSDTCLNMDNTSSYDDILQLLEISSEILRSKEISEIIIINNSDKDIDIPATHIKSHSMNFYKGNPGQSKR